MKNKSVVAKILCGAFALIMSASATACSSTNDHPLVPADGYELPYNYNDGYEAKLKTVDDTYYMTTATDKDGNKTIHFKTSETEEQVKEYYDKYFAELVSVRPKDKNDISTGYYDKEKRLIIYNLYIWTADGETNYKMGTKACDDISSDDIWEVDDANNSTTSASTTAN